MSVSLPIRRLAFVLAVCLMSFALSGCCCPYGPGRGFRLRSEWILEMNRGAGASCEAAACEAEGPACVTCDDAPSCCGPARCGTCCWPCGGLLAGLGRLLTPPPPPPIRTPCSMYPRFHPVPAQPVFSRRDLPNKVGAGFGPLPPEPPEADARDVGPPAQKAPLPNSSP